MTLNVNTSAPFPSIVPSSRRFTPAKWQVKSFRSQSGSEVRILYGDQASEATLNLTYSNLSDLDAELFVEHFRKVKGTFQQFPLGAPGTTVGSNLDELSPKGGWAGDPTNFGKGFANQSKWRYADVPQLESVKRGVSNVTVNLVAVL